MTADSCRHVECDCGFDSLHSSHSRRPETGRLGECRPTPATGRVQTQRSAAKIEQPGSIILDRPVPDLAGLEIRVDIRATRNCDVLASEAVQAVLVEVIPTETTRPSTNQTWMTFLRNHVGQMVSVDFFTVPTLQLRVLYVFVILAHDRRRVLHFNVTEHPTAAWTARQMVEAFPDDTVPRYLIRDRDGIYGHDFTTRVDGLGIQQVPISARSPWQNCYAERVIGSIRRECLNHVIVINQRHLRRILKSYFGYYHRWRTHLSLDKDAPESRPVQALQAGRIIQIREVGGLHHRYESSAA